MRLNDNVESGDLPMRHLPHVATVTVCGLNEISACEQPPSHVLSICDPGQSQHITLVRRSHCQRTTLEFHDIIGPAPGWVAPTQDHVKSILEFGRALADPRSQSGPCDLLIHCNKGLSRSTASLAIILAQSNPDMGGDEIFEIVSRIRPQAWPNSLMIRHADNLLGRGGGLFKGLHAIYRRQLITFPAYKAHLCQIGRGAEVEMAATAQAS